MGFESRGEICQVRDRRLHVPRVERTGDLQRDDPCARHGVLGEGGKGRQRARDHELAATVASVAGREVRATEVSAEQLTAILVGAGLPQGYAQVLASADEGISRGELEVSTGDLERLIGRPPTTLREAVEQTLAV